MNTTASELIRMDKISKSYGRIRALENVSLNVGRQEIVGLLGDNGAGKSTLIKVLSGAVPATSGSIWINGRKVQMRDTTDAMEHGIETIYQDSALVPELSIARNLFLGREPIAGPAFFNHMDRKRMDEITGELLRKVGITKGIAPSTSVRNLSGGERQAVAIARAMYFKSQLIILDEPTNNLGVAETRGVLNFISGMRESGHSCIFIAHNIHHVFQVVDRMIVMRRGSVAADNIRPQDTSVDRIEALITGFEEQPATNEW